MRVTHQAWAIAFAREGMMATILSQRGVSVASGNGPETPLTAGMKKAGEETLPAHFST